MSEKFDFFAAMGNWQEIANSIFLAIVFAFMVAKLISIVVSFRDDNLRVERDHYTPAAVEDDALEPPAPDVQDADENSQALLQDRGVLQSEREELAGVSSENEELRDQVEFMQKNEDETLEIAESEAEGKVEEVVSEPGYAVKEIDVKCKEAEGFGGSLLSDEDEWEGVESTELDEMFGVAASYVASMEANMSQKVPNEAQMELYGLYKVATEGPCNIPQPSPLKITARAKWHAWQRLGNMNPEEAMEQYIGVLNKIFPRWSESLLEKNRMKDPDSSQKSASSGGMTSVFSSFMHQEGSDDEAKLEMIHSYAREADTAGLLQALEQGVPVDLRDSQGRTPLHWAVDRGHMKVVEHLLSRGADVNAKDMEGQTTLHYATMCEREGIAKYLIKHGADPSSKDNDGVTPYNLCPKDWDWLSENA